MTFSNALAGLHHVPQRAQNPAAEQQADQERHKDSCDRSPGQRLEHASAEACKKFGHHPAALPALTKALTLPLTGTTARHHAHVLGHAHIPQVAVEGLRQQPPERLPPGSTRQPESPQNRKETASPPGGYE